MYTVSDEKHGGLEFWRTVKKEAEGRGTSSRGGLKNRNQHAIKNNTASELALDREAGSSLRDIHTYMFRSTSNAILTIAGIYYVVPRSYKRLIGVRGGVIDVSSGQRFRRHQSAGRGRHFTCHMGGKLVQERSLSAGGGHCYVLKFRHLPIIGQVGT